MRNLVLALMAGMMLFALSCGGGGGSPSLPPADRDLSGLVGIWDYTVIYDGTISGPGGSGPMTFDESGFFILTRTSVTDYDGDNIAWSYDGSMLTLLDADNVVVWDATCGNMLLSVTYQWRIPLSPQATFGNTTGSCKISITSQYCPGTATGTLAVTGNMTRR